MKFYRIYIFLISALFLSAHQESCKKNPNLPGQVASETRSVDYLRKKLQARNVSKVQRLNAQAKITMSGNGQSISANANLIWVRDSVLWINVKKFGLEAVRALVTKDSVFVLNRLEKTYSAKALSSLQHQFSLPGGFEMLELALLGKAWIPEKADLQSDIKEDLHRLSGVHEGMGLDYRIEEGSYLLKNETFLQQKDSRVMSIAYSDYRKAPQIGLFPYLCDIHAFSPESGDADVEIEFSDVEINQAKAFRFEIPAHYTKE